MLAVVLWRQAQWAREALRSEKWRGSGTGLKLARGKTTLLPESPQPKERQKAPGLARFVLSAIPLASAAHGGARTLSSGVSKLSSKRRSFASSLSDLDRQICVSHCAAMT